MGLWILILYEFFAFKFLNFLIFEEKGLICCLISSCIFFPVCCCANCFVAMADIMFQDITTLLLDPKAFKDTIDLFVERYKGKNISIVAGKNGEN